MQIGFSFLSEASGRCEAVPSSRVVVGASGMLRESVIAFHLTWILQLSHRACSVIILQKQTPARLLGKRGGIMPNSTAFWRITLACSRCLGWAMPSCLVFSCAKHRRRRTDAVWFSAHLHLRLARSLDTSGFWHHLCLAMSLVHQVPADARAGCLLSDARFLSAGRKLLFQWPPPLCWVWRNPEQLTEGRWCVGHEALNLASAGDQAKMGAAAHPQRWLVGLSPSEEVSKSSESLSQI